jgi:hypothetical protein
VYCAGSAQVDVLLGGNVPNGSYVTATTAGAFVAIANIAVFTGWCWGRMVVGGGAAGRRGKLDYSPFYVSYTEPAE